jgi:hypothetical protein
MERRRNFLPLAGLLVCLLAFASYFLFFYRFPVTRDVPWANWLLFALGLGLAAVGVRRPFRLPERYRGRWTSAVLALLSVAVAGLFLFATTLGSRHLPASADAPKVGQKAPDFVLEDSANRAVRLYGLLGATNASANPVTPAITAGRTSWVILIFYRGYW